MFEMLIMLKINAIIKKADSDPESITDSELFFMETAFKYFKNNSDSLTISETFDAKFN